MPKKMSDADLNAILKIAELADAVTGEAPKSLANILAEQDRLFHERFKEEKGLNAECKALRAAIARTARRILGRSVDIDQLDAMMLIDHTNRPETVAPWFTISVRLAHARTDIHRPSLQVQPTPARPAAMIGQLHALRAAADAYTASMDATEAKP